MYLRFRQLIAFICICVLVLLASNAATAASEDDSKTVINPFQAEMEEVLRFFTPMEGTVTTVTSDTITATISGDAQAVPGMRMRVYRKGEPFLHPVTKELIVQGESPVGVLEVVSASEGSVTLRSVDGEVAVDDVVRISSGRIKALFYQKANVDWDISEEYYFWIKDTGRFAFVDTAPGEASDEKIAEEARKWGTDIAVIINSTGTPSEPLIHQTIMWANDGKILSEDELEVLQEELTTLKAGEDFFAPDRNKPVSVFTVPYSATLIATGDLNGDGRDEVLLADGSTIHVHDIGTDFSTPFGLRDDVSIKGELGLIPVWIESLDLDRDGDDEVILTSVMGAEARSFIYDYTGAGFNILWSGPGFIRAFDRTIYIQEADQFGGTAGAPVPLKWKDNGDRAPKDAITLPERANIYNMAILKPRGKSKVIAAFTKKGKLGIFDLNGEELWSSQQNYMPFNRLFPRIQLAEINEEELWKLNDRLISIGGSAYTFKRTSRNVNVNVQFGYSKTAFVGIVPSKNGARESILVKDMRAGALDYAISEGRLIMLSESLIPNPLNILKGKNIFSSKLYIYLLRGEGR